MFTIEKQYPEAAYFLEGWIRAQTDIRAGECKGEGPFALPRKVAGEFALEEVPPVVQDSLRELRQLRQDPRWTFEDLEQLDQPCDGEQESSGAVPGRSDTEHRGEFRKAPERPGKAGETPKEDVTALS